jgi:hypothetical protein
MKATYIWNTLINGKFTVHKTPVIIVSKLKKTYKIKLLERCREHNIGDEIIVYKKSISTQLSLTF